MGLLDRYKTTKAIDTILSAASASSPDAVQAALKLKQIGPSAIPQLIRSLEGAANPAGIESLLVGFVSSATLAPFFEGLSHPDHRVVDSITRVLCQSAHFDPNRLMDLFVEPDISKTALGRIMLTHLGRVSHKELVGLLGKVSSSTRPIVYQLLDKSLTERDVTLVVHRAKIADPGVRARLAGMLGRFSTPESRTALVDMLGDSHKNVRQAALDGLGQLTIPVPAKVVVNLLRDPDLTVQNKAIEALVKIQDAATIQYLIEILQDDSEYVRRAAVEVLNEIVDQRAIKDLLVALRDKDWWVRVRAADALGKIGGPKLVEAVLTLIRDEDEFLRRTAVEILNNSRDERAIAYLLQALGDDDWWVRERSADAIIAMGGDDVVDALRAMLGGETKSTEMVIRTLASLGDKASVDAIVPFLSSTDEAIRREAIQALDKLTDNEHSSLVQAAMTQLIAVSSENERTIIQKSLNSISTRTSASNQQPTPGDAGAKGADEAPMIDLSPQTTGTNARNRRIDVTAMKAGTIVADRFKIIRKVGKGGFGEVFLAEDMVVKDQMILKFLHSRLSEDQNMIQRFIQELRYARKVTHENVIRIYEFITFGNLFAISMEYFPGHSLADELAAHKALATKRGLKLILGMCNGMAAAQAVNVVHRDLKPANILVGDGDAVKIVDYGLAAAATNTDATLTKTGLLIGTPTYMSPERARGKPTDSRADIYSLGVIMYEMFTGRPPYTGSDPMAILLQHVEGEAAPPDKINPEIPEALSGVILTAMALDPNHRYQSFDELGRQLRRINGEIS